ncbi:unnamed protein product [Paramecium octaurelia]|uniref:Transmembrane protein n=1 Tax=Paramecium octaurelia TaxID=43137 RepID=A0A8S1T0Q2_PAROT|nr:unnamed protein product [Paramecium octaurelia]
MEMISKKVMSKKMIDWLQIAIIGELNTKIQGWIICNRNVRQSWKLIYNFLLIPYLTIKVPSRRTKQNRDIKWIIVTQMTSLSSQTQSYVKLDLFKLCRATTNKGIEKATEILMKKKVISFIILFFKFDFLMFLSIVSFVMQLAARTRLIPKIIVKLNTKCMQFQNG